jgi:hypothetical protein
MSLWGCVDHTKTDKGTTHSYIDLYDKLLCWRKESAQNVLEIGIGDFLPDGQNGGSIHMWHKYFPNATIHALDIKPIRSVMPELRGNAKIKLYTSTDAYDPAVVASTFGDMKFDVLLDDGPHTLESMKQFIRLYSDKINKDGILIIEDVQDFAWFSELEKEVPLELRKYIQYFDLRFIKERYDDLVFVIDTYNNTD